MAKAKHSLMKGAAVVAGIAAAVALVHSFKKSKKAKVLKSAAHDANEHVVAHAKKLGKFSQESYGKVVDSVLEEFGNMKSLSKKELVALKAELKAGWKKAAKKAKNA